MLQAMLTARATLIRIVLVTIAAGCRESAADRLQRADALFQQKLYDGAIAEYDRVAASEPNNPHAIRQLGLAHAAIGDRPRAIRYLERWRTMSALDSSARIALGRLYLESGRPTEAAGEASAVLAQWPDNMAALTLAGLAELDAHNPTKATEQFDRLARLAPSDAKAQYLLGEGLLAEGRTRDAAQKFEAALHLKPTYLDPLAKLVTIDLAAGRSIDALARVNAQRALVGDSSRLVQLLAIVYLARDDRANAESTLLRVMALDPTYLDPVVRLSELYRSMGRNDQALQMVDQALALDPKNLSVRLVQGVTFEAKGDPVRAARAYEIALAVNPKFAGAANNLATLLAENVRELGRALELATLAKTLEPDNPAIADTYGWVLFKRGEYAPSVAALRGAATALPSEPTIAYHLGMALAKYGDTTAARGAFRRSLAAPSPFPEREMARQALQLLR